MPGRRGGTKQRSGKQRGARRQALVRMTGKQADRAPHRTDFARLDRMDEAAIARQIAENPDAAPDVSDEMFERVEELMTETKRQQIALKVESDVLEFFRSSGPKYQTRMNAVLRAYMEQARRRRSKR